MQFHHLFSLKKNILLFSSHRPVLKSMRECDERSWNSRNRWYGTWKISLVAQLGTSVWESETLTFKDYIQRWLELENIRNGALRNRQRTVSCSHMIHTHTLQRYWSLLIFMTWSSLVCKIKPGFNLSLIICSPAHLRSNDFFKVRYMYIGKCIHQIWVVH